jgi:hypothetical protein
MFVVQGTVKTVWSFFQEFDRANSTLLGVYYLPFCVRRAGATALR